jgi:hypothetical protein
MASEISVATSEALELGKPGAIELWGMALAICKIGIKKEQQNDRR